MQLDIHPLFIPEFFTDNQLYASPCSRLGTGWAHRRPQNERAPPTQPGLNLLCTHLAFRDLLQARAEPCTPGPQVQLSKGQSEHREPGQYLGGTQLCGPETRTGCKVPTVSVGPSPGSQDTSLKADGEAEVSKSDSSDLDLNLRDARPK